MGQGKSYLPKSDVYFGEGVKFIKSVTETYHDLYFINLNAFTVTDVLVFFTKDRLARKNIVIISTKKLMKLAESLSVEYREVIAVYDSSTRVCNIVDDLNSMGGIGERQRNLKKAKSKIKYKDLVFIKRILLGLSIDRLQEMHEKGMSTIYCWKKSVARKLGVSKVECLLLNETKP